MFEEMKVYGFTIDSISHRPVILLKDCEGNTTVPLWISLKDGVSLAADLLCRDLASREGNPDLLDSLIRKLGLTLEKVMLDLDGDGDVSATVSMSGPAGEQLVDVGIAEALNAVLGRKLPLMVSDRLLDWASRYASHDESILNESNERRYADFLENLDPEQMNKLPM